MHGNQREAMQPAPASLLSVAPMAGSALGATAATLYGHRLHRDKFRERSGIIGILYQYEQYSRVGACARPAVLQVVGWYPPRRVSFANGGREPPNPSRIGDRGSDRARPPPRVLYYIPVRTGVSYLGPGYIYSGSGTMAAPPAVAGRRPARRRHQLLQLSVYICQLH